MPTALDTRRYCWESATLPLDASNVQARSRLGSRPTLGGRAGPTSSSLRWEGRRPTVHSCSAPGMRELVRICGRTCLWHTTTRPLLQRTRTRLAPHLGHKKREDGGLVVAGGEDDVHDGVQLLGLEGERNLGRDAQCDVPNGATAVKQSARVRVNHKWDLVPNLNRLSTTERAY